MPDNISYDPRIPLPNDTAPDQKANVRDADNVTAQPQASPVTPNDPVFQPSESPVAIVGEMAAGGDVLQDHAAFSQWQATDVKASGDGAAGEFSGGDDRTPAVKGLPNRRQGQLPPHSR